MHKIGLCMHVFHTPRRQVLKALVGSAAAVPAAAGLAAAAAAALAQTA